MTQKRVGAHKKLDEPEATLANENVERLFSGKIEGVNHFDRSASAVLRYTYQAFESGNVAFSATGSATVARTFSLAESHGRTLHAHANAQHSAVVALVTDLTSTAVTIEVKTISGTALFSSVTSASIRVTYLVLGSSP